MNLSGNYIPTAGGILIAKALRKNTTLQHLNLKWNKLTDKCIPAFEKALKRNTTLLSLNLSRNEGIRVVSGRKKLLWSIICDPTNLKTVANSNHTLNLVMTDRAYRNNITFEEELRNINSLGKSTEGGKIRYKVVLTLFAMNPDLFSPQTFLGVPLELMPRLLETAQQEIGYDGFSVGVVGEANKKRNGVDPTLNRLYGVIKGWNTPLLFNVSFIGVISDATMPICLHSFLFLLSLLIEGRWQIEEENSWKFEEEEGQWWKGP